MCMLWMKTKSYEEPDLQLADLVLKEGIEAITDEELERLYQSFLSTDQPF